MRSIYRIGMIDGQSNLICVEANIDDVKRLIDSNKWLEINDNTSILTDKIVSIECIARVNENGEANILRDDEYTIKQLNKYLKSIVK